VSARPPGRGLRPDLTWPKTLSGFMQFLVQLHEDADSVDNSRGVNLVTRGVY
jgi:hypothetical protein